MEELREQLYKCIEKYGPLDPRTVEASQKLDLEILKNIKKRDGQSHLKTYLIIQFNYTEQMEGCKVEEKYKEALEEVLKDLRSIEGPNEADSYIDSAIKTIMNVLEVK
ncbi:aspartyl-phosphate phosphatase Spo0E family protein [Clostridium polynesiense]|uniref:aspartyl-phosphate phosphatase Spo0E family protein n=1 Tax=Clostridium polynesiense TaxID=1325933 RepID=UPI00058BB9D9|nr:aspartyl-phosphate phosphatase Spo0E family protein [Clostridium polynesiense]